MKKRKIIHIYHRSYDSYFPMKDSEYYYLAGWSSVVARQIVKHTNKYIIENWRPEKEIENPTIREVQGVICRLFPAKYIKHFGNWSPAMLKELRKQARVNEVLIHHSGIHNLSLCLIASFFRNVPILAQHHGDCPALMRFKQNKKFIMSLAHFIEKKALRNVDHFFVLRKLEIRFLSKFVGTSHITLQTMGADFEKFKPIEKKVAREKLGLPQSKKIILYVGKFYRLKAVDIILKAFQDLKKKYDVELILIGGSPKDPLYKDVKASGAQSYGYLPHSKLPLYYNAADVYLLPAFSYDYAGGIGVAAMEALACGTPVVSTTLKDFPTDEWRKLGKVPKSPEDVVKCVTDILENPEPFKNCREVARRYYDWQAIIYRTVQVYDKLFEKYYETE